MSSAKQAEALLPRSAPSLDQFTNNFILCPGALPQPTLFEVPQSWAADLSRQRRAHRKSKWGCENCKRRRVKVIFTSASHTL